MSVLSRRYLSQMLIGFAAYALILAISLTLLVRGIDNRIVEVTVSLAPMIPAFFIAFVILRHVRQMDEMQRRIQFEAVAFAFVGTALITFSYGFLENTGLPRLSAMWVWPLMGGLWFLGGLLAKRRYE